LSAVIRKLIVICKL